MFRSVALPACYQAAPDYLALVSKNIKQMCKHYERHIRPDRFVGEKLPNLVPSLQPVVVINCENMVIGVLNMAS